MEEKKELFTHETKIHLMCAAFMDTDEQYMIYSQGKIIFKITVYFLCAVLAANLIFIIGGDWAPVLKVIGGLAYTLLFFIFLWLRKCWRWKGFSTNLLEWTTVIFTAVTCGFLKLIVVIAENWRMA